MESDDGDFILHLDDSSIRRICFWDTDLVTLHKYNCCSLWSNLSSNLDSFIQKNEEELSRRFDQDYK